MGYQGKLNNVNFTFWGDNQAVLYQIHQEGAQIVINRTKKIKLFNQATGLNVPTDSNPADLLTREITLEQFQASDSWKFAIVRRFCSNLLAKKKGQEKISGCT